MSDLKELLKTLYLVAIFRDTPAQGNSTGRNEKSINCFLDYAKFKNGGSYEDSTVEDIKKLAKILVVFAALLPYWIVYYQVFQRGTSQKCGLKLCKNNYN